MGLVGWIKKKVVARKVKGYMEDAEMGRLGSATKGFVNFFSGWKSWLLATVMTLGVLFPESGVIPYAQIAVDAVPGEAVAEFDPNKAAIAIAWVVATGGRFLKALNQYRDGVSIKDLNSY